MSKTYIVVEMDDSGVSSLGDIAHALADCGVVGRLSGWSYQMPPLQPHYVGENWYAEMVVPVKKVIVNIL